jgi:hypothetical protein
MNSHAIAENFCQLSIELLDQSMIKIRHCFTQLSEEQVWSRPQDSINSVGNLCLHLSGNLRQWGIVPFIDAGDERDRESEFNSDVRTSKDELMKQLATTIAQSKQIWLKLEPNVLLQETEIQGFKVSCMHAVSHTSCHFVGHTHQIILLTRILLGEDYRFQWSPETGSDNVPI